MTHTLSSVCCGSLFVLLAACASSGVDRAESAVQSMRGLKDALAAAPEKITAVSASLTELSKEGGDMKAEFATFDSKVNSLIEHRDQIRSLRQDVEASRDDFTKAWQEKMATISNEQLRARAEERRTAVVSRFAELGKQADAGREEFEPWMKMVTDVRSYLENDLNPAGVASVRDMVRNIDRGASSVNKKISSLVGELEEMSKAIAATRPPEPTPEEKAAAEKK